MGEAPDDCMRNRCYGPAPDGRSPVVLRAIARHDAGRCDRRTRTKAPSLVLFPAARVRARSHSPRAAVRRLAISRFVSSAGTDATGVAIGFTLYAQTRSATWLSLSLMITVGTSALLSPLAGRAGDLVDRRRLMIGAEVAAAAVFLALALVHTPAALLGLGLLASAIGTIFGPASGAAIAHVAGERHLTWASGLIATGSNVGKTAGRLGAG